MSAAPTGVSTVAASSETRTVPVAANTFIISSLSVIVARRPWTGLVAIKRKIEQQDRAARLRGKPGQARVVRPAPSGNMVTMVRWLPELVAIADDAVSAGGAYE